MDYLLTSFLFFSTFFQITAQTETQASMQDWHYPYAIHQINLSDHLDLAYIDEGKGKCTLLFLHGLGSNLKAWQKNIDVLKNDYRCIAVDLPGYGKSTKKDYAFSMSFFATTIRSFIDKMNLDKVILIGHSMGGQIAIQTVLNNEESIEKLILLAPAGFETFTEEEKTWFQNFYTAAVIKATSEAQIVKNFHLNFYAFPSDAQFMIDDRLLMRQSAEYDHYCNMIPQCVLGMLNEPVFNRLSEIKRPTLILFGEKDALIPNKFLHAPLTTSGVAKSGQERIPNSELKLLPSAGHFVQWEQATEVNKAILKFLK